MGILNPVVSKFTLVQGVPQEVYVCPGSKTHAVVDLSFFKDDLGGDALIAVALASESNPNNLTTIDYFIDDIQLVGAVNSAELNKVIVGQGERLFINFCTVYINIVTKSRNIYSANIGNKYLRKTK